MSKDFSQFEKKINIIFDNKDLLVQAFVHRSYINENPHFNIYHNERLEFLGDAVLELVTTDYLFRKYGDKTEGEMTSYRASIVNTKAISQAATDLEMNDFLLLSKGESKDEGKARRDILADTFEAVIGAIYLDRGYDVARDFIAKNLFHYLEEIITKGLWKDSKSLFQEKAQEYTGITPEYKLLKEAGPDHDKHFIIGVFLRDELIAQGEGKSKQSGDQEAASAALKIKGWDKPIK